MSELRFVDADGHIVEHPSAMLDFAPHAYRERVWHAETDANGDEWIVMNGAREPANVYVASAVAGFSEQDKARAFAGEIKFSDMPRGAYDPRARLEALDADGIDLTVLYPTGLLAIYNVEDLDFAKVMCRVYNDWLSDHCAQGDGRLYGAAVIPQQDIEAAAAEVRRVAKLPHIVAAFLRPNPTADWKPFSDPVYDPLWEAFTETGLALGFHPLLSGDIPGAATGLRIKQLDFDTALNRGELDLRPALPGLNFGHNNHFFVQALSNPIDMMNTIAFVLGGGVCQRFPELRMVFLEANGGWIVPWLERLDHHWAEFRFDVPWLEHPPSHYFRRQCWISFDPDESTLAFTAESPLVGADRMVWASDYPHPDAKFPGTTRELAEATASLTAEQRNRIAGANTSALYGIDV
ncbi:MAG: amidohydrolase family protein [Proteobacteria bacterium]|nr:amidohydrolase family protein [Pseudomonadota bacterium]